MANTIKIRRSAVASAVPTTAQLALGELALNTFDGKLFLKKNNGTESIVEIGAGGGVTSFSAGTTGLTPSTGTAGAVTLAGTLAVANGGTGVTTSTGSGSNVLSTSPTLTTPVLGTPTSGTLTNCTGYTFENIASKPTTRDGYGITDVPKTDGTSASGSWGISVTGSSASCTGNASTATTATNANNINRNGILSTTSANYRVLLGPTNNTAGYGACSVVTNASRLYYNPSTDTLLCGTFSGSATELSNQTLVSGAATINTVVGRNGSGDIFARLIRQDFADQATISGGMVFRVNNTTDNYLRVCNDEAAIRTFLNVPTRTGGNASGTWTINITGTSAACSGNAATVTNGVYANTNNADGLTFGTANTNPALNNVSGASITPGGLISCSRDSIHSLSAGRRLDDGAVITIHQAGTQEGSISVAGATVSYNAFLGSHWARLTDNSKPEILVGTVLETIDKLVEWKCIRFEVDGEQKIAPYYGSANFGETASIDYEGSVYLGIIESEVGEEGSVPDINKHVCVKVSDTLKSTAVYGVFVAWDIDPMEGMTGGWNDISCGSLGNYVIRMAPGETPAIGDLVQSAGNGCAIVQDDDIIRSSTIGKITSTILQRTYEDGSFLVTCVLYCG